MWQPIQVRCIHTKPQPTNTMQPQSNLLLNMLAIAGISASAFSAKAATFAQGDLLLGFNKTSGTGSDIVLTVDLGNSSQFVNAHTNGTNLTNIASLGTILSSTYGTSMLSSQDSTVFWTVAAANNTGTSITNNGVTDTQKTSYVTRAQEYTGLTINAYGQVTNDFTTSQTVRNTFASQIGAAQSSYANYESTTGTSPVAVPSYGTGWANSAAVSWGSPSLYAQGRFASGPTGTALDLYRILGQFTGSVTSQYLGTFSINSSGEVSFNTTDPSTLVAAPEPSRTLLAALGLGGLLLRRRRVKA